MKSSKVIKLNPNEKIRHEPGLKNDMMCIKTSDGLFMFNPMHFKLQILEDGWIHIKPRRKKPE